VESTFAAHNLIVLNRSGAIPIGKDKVMVFGRVLILEHFLGLNDLCHISKSRLWNLYFCPEGLELELLQTGTRAQIEDSEGVTANICQLPAGPFRSNNGEVGLGDLKSTVVNSNFINYPLHLKASS